MLEDACRNRYPNGNTCKSICRVFFIYSCAKHNIVRPCSHNAPCQEDADWSRDLDPAEPLRVPRVPYPRDVHRWPHGPHPRGLRGGQRAAILPRHGVTHVERRGGLQHVSYAGQGIWQRCAQDGPQGWIRSMGLVYCMDNLLLVSMYQRWIHLNTPLCIQPLCKSLSCCKIR